MPKSDEVSCGLPPTFEIVNPHGGKSNVIPANQQSRDAGIMEGLELASSRGPTPSNDDGVHALLAQDLQVVSHCAGVSIRVADEHCIFRLSAHILNTARDLGIVRVGDVWNYQSKGVCVFLVQTSGEGIRAVVQFLNDTQHPPPKVSTNATRSVVQHAGHGCDGDICPARDIMNGYGSRSRWLSHAVSLPFVALHFRSPRGGGYRKSPASKERRRPPVFHISGDDAQI